jgi:hypothetical protein
MNEERKSLFDRIRSAARTMLVQRGFLRDDSPEDDEGDVLVGAPIRPRPHLNSGAVALELPDDPKY